MWLRVRVAYMALVLALRSEAANAGCCSSELILGRDTAA